MTISARFGKGDDSVNIATDPDDFQSGDQLSWCRDHVFSLISSGVLLTNPSGTIVWANQILLGLVKSDLASLSDRSFRELFSPNSHQPILEFLSAGTESCLQAEVSLIDIGGQQTTSSLTASFLEFDGNRYACLLLDYPSVEMESFDDLAEAERWFHSLAESSSDIIAVLDRAVRLKYANPAIERILGISVSERPKVNILEYIHPDDLPRAEELLISRSLVEGVHSPSTYRIRTGNGDYRIMEIITTNRLNDPAIKGIIINARDVTERYNLTRALRTLSKGNQVMMHAKDEKALLRDMCQAIVESGDYRLAWVGYCQDDEAKSIVKVAAAGCTGYLAGQKFSWGENEYGMGPGGVAIRSGQGQVNEDIAQSAVFAPWWPKAKEHGLRSVCVLPLMLDETIIGTLAIYSGEVGVFDDSAVELLQELANDLGFGIGLIRDAHALIESEHRFRTLTSVAPIGILEISSGVVQFANARAAEICGKDIDDIVGTSWIARYCTHLRSIPSKLAGEISDVGQVKTSSFRIDRPDGSHRHVRMSVVSSSIGSPDSYIATLEDITAEVLTKEALVHQAFHDSLTGLPNRSLFLERLEQELARCKRGVSDIAVLFLDLDRLKIVNDGLGHEAGDAVLKEVSRRFTSAIRLGETAARFSGDEFVFIIRDIHNYQEATVVADRLLATLKTPVSYMGNELILSGSVGIVLPDGSSDPKNIIRDADTAMYKAKATGGGNYELFDEELHRRSLERLNLEGQLRQAIAAEEFELYYQPKVDPQSLMPVGAEALIRWHHPGRGLVLPSEFVAVAEESGLIREIGSWVIGKAIEQLSAWDAMPNGPKLKILSVNMSTLQLEDLGLVEMVQDLVQSFTIAPGRFAIELTESALMKNSESTSRSLRELEKLGVLIGIDDFGTGYSSLSYLHTLPVAVVKVDRTFIERLGSFDDSTPIVKAILDMSHALGMGVVAEGVSSEHLQNQISTMGFELAQGYHFAPPMPVFQFEKWWSKSLVASVSADR